MKEKETEAFHFSYSSTSFQEDIEQEFGESPLEDPPDIPPESIVAGTVVRYSGVVPYKRRPRRRSFRPLGCLAALICLLVPVTVWILFQQATITLTLPGISRIERVQISLRSEGSDARSSQLHTWTQTGGQSYSITASGHKDVAAAQARGLLVFYNQSPAPQRVAQGTQFQLSGFTITLDQEALIPAASLPTPGQGTFPAHIEQTGPRGNIAAGTLNQLITTNISVKNLAFAGGQEAATLPVLQALDIEQVVKVHQDEVRLRVQQALKAHIPTIETPLDQPQCKLDVRPSAPAGSTLSQARVDVHAACSQQSYRREEVLAKARAWVYAHNAPPSEGYQLVRVQLHTVSLSFLTQEDRLASVTIQEEWHYALSEARQQQLKALVAGMSTSDAKNSVCVALPQCEATIQYPWMWLPADGQKINFSVQYRDRSV